MDRVEEIEVAINNLPPEEYRRLSQWFRELDETRWDEQMDRDSAAGKLDFLFDEAANEQQLIQMLILSLGPEYTLHARLDETVE